MLAAWISVSDWIMRRLPDMPKMVPHVLYPKLFLDVTLRTTSAETWNFERHGTEQENSCLNNGLF